MKNNFERYNTRSVRRLRKNLKLIITFSVALFTFLFAIIQKVLEEFGKSDNPWVLTLLLLGAIAVYTFLLVIRQGRLVDWIFNLAGKVQKDKYVGSYQIAIEYDEPLKSSGSPKQKVEIRRNGYCKIVDTISGLRIDGGQILDESKNLQVDDWHSNNVEIIEYADLTKLIYTYFTYEDDGIKPTKIGIANLSRVKSTEAFTGVFRDFNVQHGKTERHGTVSLYRTDS